MDDFDFIEELASAAPVPGGGGASAYCGAVAAALSSMVGNLTVGKKRYADVEDEVLGCIARLAILRSRLLELMEADADAFEPLSEAYRMPHSTEQETVLRNEAIQDSLVEATEVPLSIMAALIDVLHECDFLAHHGSKMAISDAGASAVLGKAALVSASLNVYINTNSMSDVECADEYRMHADQLIEEGSRMADQVYDYVADEIGAYKEEK